MYLSLFLPHAPPFCEFQVLGRESPHAHGWRAGIHVDVCHDCTPYVGENNGRQQRRKTVASNRDKLFMILREETKILYRRTPSQRKRTLALALALTRLYTPTPRMYSYVLGGPMMEPCAKYCYPWVRHQTGVSETNLGDFWIRGSGRIGDFGDGPTTTAMTTTTKLSQEPCVFLLFFFF